MALQPIVDLTANAVCGYEALARFPAGSDWTPDRWFDAADRVGMGTALESAAVHAALRLLPRLGPSHSLAINVSAPALMKSTSIPELFTGPDAYRLILELTEHQRIDEPERLNEALGRVRDAGVRIAVDDAGSGYAGLERILLLAPEVLKLDRTLVGGVANHPGQQAMCEAMVRFTQRMGARLVAEGVETQEDLDMLASLGVSHAQGYLLGRPTVWT
jgi:EAL domain-containing protein (putative c-di-GMP-specific phosphodiesterase class I)